MMNNAHCDQNFLGKSKKMLKNSQRVLLVLIITIVTMVVEIYFGYLTGSMSLLADGWHMATHAAALGITYITYRIVMNEKIIRHFNFGGGKLIPLGGFTSALFLLGISIYIIIEATARFLRPEKIEFNEALIVAIIGLVINLICAFILRPYNSHHHHHHHGHHHHHHHGHHHHHHGHDHNIMGAYLHVVADALTSLAAIFALLAGSLWGIQWLDPVVGIVSSIVILHWAINLIRDSGWELLDGHARGVNYDKLKTRIESLGAKIDDLHVWHAGPETIVGELIVAHKNLLGVDAYRNILEKEFHINHSVIEERRL
jgi:cation diffusion facilitator family transporter